jgi:hypothetical protein
VCRSALRKPAPTQRHRSSLQQMSVNHILRTSCDIGTMTDSFSDFRRSGLIFSFMSEPFLKGIQSFGSLWRAVPGRTSQIAIRPHYCPPQPRSDHLPITRRGLSRLPFVLAADGLGIWKSLTRKSRIVRERHLGPIRRPQHGVHSDRQPVPVPIRVVNGTGPDDRTQVRPKVTPSTSRISTWPSVSAVKR